MIKKIINYTDLNGDECQDEYYFNLNKAELFSLDFDYQDQGGFINYVKTLANNASGKAIWELLQTLITKAVGKRSADGKRLIKNAEIAEEFRTSEGFGELLIELMTDEEKLTEFVQGIMSNVVSELKKNNGGKLPEVDDPELKALIDGAKPIE